MAYVSTGHFKNDQERYESAKLTGFLVAYFLFVGSALVFLNNHWESQARGGASAIASVERAWRGSEKKNAIYYANIAFETEKKEQIKINKTINASLYQIFKTRKKVRVLYSPDRPGLAVFEGGDSHSRAGLYMLFGVLAALGYGFYGLAGVKGEKEKSAQAAAAAAGSDSLDASEDERPEPAAHQSLADQVLIPLGGVAAVALGYLGAAWWTPSPGPWTDFAAVWVIFGLLAGPLALGLMAIVMAVPLMLAAEEKASSGKGG
jgi:hypothetical protein